MHNQLAVVFPGQGSQSVGMLSELAKSFPVVSQYFQQASDVLDYDLWQIVEEGPVEKLNQTIYTQPAMLVADVVMWLIFREVNQVSPTILAGHSLGEYAALVAAESIHFKDAVKLVSTRAQLMQEAVPEGRGAMAVALGLTDDQIIEACEKASSGDDRATPANFNAPGQIVVAGTASAIEKMMIIAKEMGAKLVKKLPMSVPSHCFLMQNAAEQLAEVLQNISISKPSIPVIHNVDVLTHDEPADIRLALAQQLYGPVQWIKTIQAISEKGVSTIIECGPGKILTGLNKRIKSNLNLIALSNTNGLTIGG